MHLFPPAYQFRLADQKAYDRMRVYLEAKYPRMKFLDRRFERYSCVIIILDDEGIQGITFGFTVKCKDEFATEIVKRDVERTFKEWDIPFVLKQV